MYILYFLYSFAAGVAAYFVFRSELIQLLFFMLIFEMFVYLFFRNFGMTWDIKERISFNIFFFLGYFSFFIAYEDFDDRDYYNYNNNIQ